MLKEMEFTKALEAIAAGKRVMVLQPATTDPDDINYIFSDLESWLKGCRLLIDVPAAIKQEAEEAVAGGGGKREKAYRHWEDSGSL